MTAYVVTIDGIEHTVKPRPAPDLPQMAVVSYPNGFTFFSDAECATRCARTARSDRYRVAARAYLKWLEAREAAS